jgi:hypothetical protein
MLTGFVSGVFTVLANTAGPIITVYLLTLSLPKEEFNGTRASIFALINCFKIPVQGYLGNIKVNDFWMIIPLMFTALVSTFFAEAWLLPSIKQDTFKKISWLLVIIGAIKLLLGV